MLRLFAAVDLPPALRRRLAALARPLPRARWVDPENMHLTLRFVGEVDEGLAADLDAELARIAAPAFDLRLAGVGHFGSGGRARALWAGVVRSPALAGLRQRVDRAARRAGLPPDGRRFTPHVTLARLRDTPLAGAAPFLAGASGFAAPPFAVTRFTLYSSWRGREGPAYVAERRYPLAAAAPEAADAGPPP